MEVINGLVCKITENNIHIEDSYQIKSKPKMREVLYAIQHNHPECNSFKRSYKSMIAEWRTHNRLYRLGYKKNRTGSVDINYPLKWYIELAYRILGI